MGADYPCPNSISGPFYEVAYYQGFAIDECICCTAANRWWVCFNFGGWEGAFRI
jgi:hypothetical protein